MHQKCFFFSKEKLFHESEWSPAKRINLQIGPLRNGLLFGNFRVIFDYITILQSVRAAFSYRRQPINAFTALGLAEFNSISDAIRPMPTQRKTGSYYKDAECRKVSFGICCVPEIEIVLCFFFSNRC